MMSKLVFLLLLVLAFASCRQPANEIVITEKPKEIRKFGKGIKTVDVQIGESFSALPVKLDRNLYGKFFYDRAEYYIIDNPTNKIWGKEILKTTLFYFDGQLYKIKHLMKSDISYDLINHHPRFKVKALDSVSRMIVKSQAVVFRQDNKLTLNDNLSRYELTWLKDDKQIKWKTSFEGEGNYYEYSECLADYKRKYRELEIFENNY